MEYNTDAYNYDSCTFNEEEFEGRLTCLKCGGGETVPLYGFLR